METKNGRMRNGATGREASGTRVIGIGGAGWHMLRALAPRAIGGMSLAEMNTDLRAGEVLEGVARYQIGGKLTRGLGAGGDPEVGARAACESAETLGEAAGDCAAAVLMMGLGGGTATGAAPVVAAEARRRGARVVGLCAMPFEFEGRRRREQARHGLELLRRECDAVFAFENDMLAQALPEDAGVEEAFGLCSEMLARMAIGLHRALACRGIMEFDPADLARVLGSDGCRVGWGEGIGEQRVNEALDRLMGAPMLKGIGAGVAWDVVVQVTSGPEMSLADIQKITKRVRKEFGDQVSLTLGAVVDPGLRGQIDILLCMAQGNDAGVATCAEGHREEEGNLSPVAEDRPKRNGARPSRVPHVKALRQMVPPPPPPPPPPAPPLESEGVEPEDGEVGSIDAEAATDRAEGGSGEIEPAEAEVLAELEVGETADEMPEETPEDGEQVGAAAPIFRVGEGDDEGEGLRFGEVGARGNGMVQSAFNFDTPSRGRFDKTEVTMYKGENLDIPTFMRRRMRITVVEG